MLTEMFDRDSRYTFAGALLLIPPLSYYLSLKVKDLLTERTTVLYDIPKLGIPRSEQRIKGTALICGGR